MSRRTWEPRVLPFSTCFDPAPLLPPEYVAFVKALGYRWLSHTSSTLGFLPPRWQVGGSAASAGPFGCAPRWCSGGIGWCVRRTCKQEWTVVHTRTMASPRPRPLARVRKKGSKMRRGSTLGMPGPWWEGGLDRRVPQGGCAASRPAWHTVLTPPVSGPPRPAAPARYPQQSPSPSSAPPDDSDVRTAPLAQDWSAMAEMDAGGSYDVGQPAEMHVDLALRARGKDFWSAVEGKCALASFPVGNANVKQELLSMMPFRMKPLLAVLSVLVVSLGGMRGSRGRIPRLF